ncbi:hypothetical protein FQN54_001479 [Arachnomyces sp. PD_36]|nr:hypothetical protein FQN54_001479 [Arachnomyces sp. PD_36]
MDSPLSRLLRIACVVLFGVQTAAGLTSKEPPQRKSITRDVVILGGGATGTYAAILLQDLGKSVAVVERNDHLGGHSATFYTSDGSHMDYGVQGFFNTNTTRTFLNRLNIDSEPLRQVSNESRKVNFNTGEQVPEEEPAVDTTASLLQYSLALSNFPYFLDGAYDLPDPVPEDLLIPFGEFVKKYNVESIIPIAFVFAHSVGNLMDTPAIYVIQDFGIPHVTALLGGYVKAKNGTAEVYNRAAEILSADVLYESTAVTVSRPGNEQKQQGIIVEAKSASGRSTIINADKLLITIPPSLQNFKGFDLDDEEKSLFSQWLYKSYYIAVVGNTGIPDGVSVVNTIPENPGSLPREPFVWHLDDVGVPGYKTTKIVGNASFSEEDAKKLLLGNIQQMHESGTFVGAGEAEIIAWGSHTPITMSVSPEAVRGGFYRDLYALQGHRNTFYTGLAWCSDYSALLWGCTDRVVGKML